jgi:hypothetical protein
MANGPSLFADVGEMVSPIPTTTPEMSEEIVLRSEVKAVRQEE